MSLRSFHLLLLVLAAPALARAEDPAPTPADVPASAPPAVDAPSPAPPATADPAPPAPPPAEAPLPKVGLRIGLGAPDGVTAALVVRPLPSVRLQAGPSWNYLAYGVQAGVAITPFRWAISPVLEASYGHYFSADLNKVAKGIPVELQAMASSVGYDYFNGQVGLEFGSPSGFTVSLGAGLSYFWSDLTGTATLEPEPGATNPARVAVTNPSLRAVIPSVRLGMLFYF